jgi:ABC-type transporter Mla subunit MlaD
LSIGLPFSLSTDRKTRTETIISAQENVMLQANEIQQRFTQIQQTIRDAEQVCQSEHDAPNEIRDAIQKLSRESEQAQSVMQSNDQQRMVQCVDSLESISDEAKRASRSNPQMAQPLQAAVMRVHDELSNLKHQLH